MGSPNTSVAAAYRDRINIAHKATSISALPLDLTIMQRIGTESAPTVTRV